MVMDRADLVSWLYSMAKVNPPTLRMLSSFTLLLQFYDVCHRSQQHGSGNLILKKKKRLLKIVRAKRLKWTYSISIPWHQCALCLSTSGKCNIWMWIQKLIWCCSTMYMVLVLLLRIILKENATISREKQSHPVRKSAKRTRTLGYARIYQPQGNTNKNSQHLVER